MGDIQQWFSSLPPMTRTWFGGTIALSLLGRFNMPSPYWLVLDYSAVVHGFQVRIPMSGIFWHGLWHWIRCRFLIILFLLLILILILIWSLSFICFSVLFFFILFSPLPPPPPPLYPFQSLFYVLHIFFSCLCMCCYTVAFTLIMKKLSPFIIVVVLLWKNMHWKRKFWNICLMCFILIQDI